MTTRTENNTNVVIAGSNWQARYIRGVDTDAEVCCELRELHANEQASGSPYAIGFGDDESQALSDARAELVSKLTR